MSFPNINEPAMKLINFFDAPIQEKVKVCTSRYTPPKEWTGYFAYLLHRIWNAVKSLFNASDWQVAKQAIIDGELKEPANLFKKVFPFQYKEQKLNVAFDYALKVMDKKIPTQKEIQDNPKTIAEDFLTEILEINIKNTEAKPSITTLSDLVKLKEDHSFDVTQLVQVLKIQQNIQLSTNKSDIEIMKQALQKLPEGKSRQELLAGLIIIWGIDQSTFFELQKIADEKSTA